ncbi:MAG: prepilin-type N-terminal cleavage/methylation domain-containing protein [Candidatus Eremiobacterota bacterium]
MINKLKKSGFSLVELIISIIIISLMLTAISVVMISSMRLSVIGRARGGIQGSAISAIGYLTRELMESDIRSARVENIDANCPAAISFLSAVEINGVDLKYELSTGKMAWQKYIIYFLFPDTATEDKMLIRKEYNPKDTATPPLSGFEYYIERTIPLLSEDMEPECNYTPGDSRCRVIAHGIYKLEAVLPDPNEYVSKRYMTISVTVRAVSLKKHMKEQSEYKTRVYFRN